MRVTATPAIRRICARHRRFYGDVVSFYLRLPDGACAYRVYGYLGVHAFFVISGFIVPYAMDVRITDRPGQLDFIARRIVRLEPPYVMSVLLILCVPYFAGLTPWFDGDISAHDVYRAALHFFYLVPWTGEEWFSTVYWSLAIEFQYYFLILAAAPFLLYRKNLWPQRAFFLIVFRLVEQRREPARLHVSAGVRLWLRPVPVHAARHGAMGRLRLGRRCSRPSPVVRTRRG